MDLNYESHHAMIRVYRGEERVSLGTGFLIADGIVMTARHILYDDAGLKGDAALVDFIDESTSINDGRPFPIDVAFDGICKNGKDGDQVLDIALLRLPSCSLSAPLSLLGNDGFRDKNRDWVLRGFPEYADEGESDQSDGKAMVKDALRALLKPLSDNVVAIDAGEPEFEISFNKESDGLKVWSGHSGSPLWIDGRIYGVLSEIRKNPKQLIFVSTLYLLQKNIEAFTDCVVTASPDYDIQSAVEALCQDKNAKDCLCDQWELSPDCSIDQLKEYCLAIGRKQLVRSIGKAQRHAKDRNNLKVLGALGVFLKRVFPVKANRHEVQQIQAQFGKKTPAHIEVSYRTDFMAESLMAAASGRAVEYEMVPDTKIPDRHTPKAGKFRLPLPPESGDEDKTQMSEAIKKGISKANGESLRLKMSAIRSLLLDQLWGDQKEEIESQMDIAGDLINDYLQDQFEDDQAAYYFIWDEALDGLEIELKDKHPHITVLKLTGGDAQARRDEHNTRRYYGEIDFNEY